MSTLAVSLLGIVGTLMATVSLLSLLSPTRVEYTEEILIAAAPNEIYDDIRFQDRLMRWSAWPKETGSTCSVDEAKSTDGTLGARTAFFSKGKQVGFQEIVDLKENSEVTLTLEGPGPPHEPTLRFTIAQHEDNRSRVTAHFINKLPRPFNAVWKFAGMSKWTREMHRKDLEGLKAFSEPPHLDADGNVVGRSPSGENPYAHKAGA